MEWDERLREKEPYQGVLFVSREGMASEGELRLHRGAPEGREQAQFALHRGASEGREQGELPQFAPMVASRAKAQMLDARLDGETIRIRWMDGRGTELSWPALQECTGLARLRSPHLVFVSGSDTIGLLFTSSTPHEGLQLVQPHSLIAPIGWLTEKGFEAA